jgi:hypothetical protein
LAVASRPNKSVDDVTNKIEIMKDILKKILSIADGPWNKLLTLNIKL